MKLAFAIVVLSLGVLAQVLPNPNLTPGVARTTDKIAICSTQTLGLRHVTPAEKRQVFASYGINCGGSCGKLYEVDHLISLEIGGTNDIANLWPQPYSPTPGAHQKDVLENKLHKLICNSMITPTQAQKEISTNWYQAYKKYVRGSDTKLGR